MEESIYQGKKNREQQKEKIALKLVKLIKEQNVSVDIALKSFERAKDIILISTNV